MLPRDELNTSLDNYSGSHASPDERRAPREDDCRALRRYIRQINGAALAKIPSFERDFLPSGDQRGV